MVLKYRISLFVPMILACAFEEQGESISGLQNTVSALSCFLRSKQEFFLELTFCFGQHCVGYLSVSLNFTVRK